MVVLLRTAGNTTVPQHCRAEQRREDAEVLLIGADRSAGGQPLRELDGVNAPGSVCARPFALFHPRHRITRSQLCSISDEETTHSISLADSND